MFSKLKNRLLGDDGVGYEELSEKKTTKLGYVLLIIMFLFLVGVGQTVFSDLGQIVEYPTSPSTCATSLRTEILNSLSCGERSSSRTCNCTFTQTDIQFGIDILYVSIKPELEKIAKLNEEIDTLTARISKANRDISTAER